MRLHIWTAGVLMLLFFSAPVVLGVEDEANPFFLGSAADVKPGKATAAAAVSPETKEMRFREQTKTHTTSDARKKTSSDAIVDATAALAAAASAAFQKEMQRVKEDAQKLASKLSSKRHRLSSEILQAQHASKAASSRSQANLRTVVDDLGESYQVKMGDSVFKRRHPSSLASSSVPRSKTPSSDLAQQLVALLDTGGGFGAGAVDGSFLASSLPTASASSSSAAAASTNAFSLAEVGSTAKNSASAATKASTTVSSSSAATATSRLEKEDADEFFNVNEKSSSSSSSSNKNAINAEELKKQLEEQRLLLQQQHTMLLQMQEQQRLLREQSQHDAASSSLLSSSSSQKQQQQQQQKSTPLDLAHSMRFAAARLSSSSQSSSKAKKANIKSRAHSKQHVSLRQQQLMQQQQHQRVFGYEPPASPSNGGGNGQESYKSTSVAGVPGGLGYDTWARPADGGDVAAHQDLITSPSIAASAAVAAASLPNPGGMSSPSLAQIADYSAQRYEHVAPYFPSVNPLPLAPNQRPQLPQVLYNQGPWNGGLSSVSDTPYFPTQSIGPAFPPAAIAQPVNAAGNSISSQRSIPFTPYTGVL